MPEIPDQPMIDSDDLPPTQYLILEVLAARHRTGEQQWTFPSQLAGTLRVLGHQGLIGYKSGIVPRTYLAWLTDEGRRAALMDGYQIPIEKERESAYRAGREDAARAVESMPYQLGDEGWKWLEGKASDAGWAVEWVSRRRRRDDFTTATIESAYQYGYRRAAEIARGEDQDTPEGRDETL